MSQTTAVSGQPVINDGGTVLNGGNVASDSRITKNITIADAARYNGNDYGSQVVAQVGISGDMAGVQKAVAGGTLAYTPTANGTGSENWIMRGVTTKLGGVTNGVLLSGSDYDGSGPRVNKIHSTVKTQSLGVGAEYNMLAVSDGTINPNHTAGSGVGVDSFFVKADDGSTTATDDAANPTRAIPGELTYHFGGLGKPTTDEYQPIQPPIQP